MQTFCLRMSAYHFSVKWIASYRFVHVLWKSSIWLLSLSLARSIQTIHLYSYLDSVLTSFLHTMSNKFQFLNSSQLDFEMKFRIQCSSTQQKLNYNLNAIVFRSSARTNSVYTFVLWNPLPWDGVCEFISISWQTFSRCLLFCAFVRSPHHKQHWMFNSCCVQFDFM